jgi:hypothetical protein
VKFPRQQNGVSVLAYNERFCGDVFTTRLGTFHARWSSG